MDINEIDDAIQRLANDVEVADNFYNNSFFENPPTNKKAVMKHYDEVYAAVVRFLEDVGLREPIKV